MKTADLMLILWGIETEKCNTVLALDGLWVTKGDNDLKHIEAKVGMNDGGSPACWKFT